MHLPGFAAEASLYPTVGRYRRSAAPNHGVVSDAVIAQLSAGGFPGSGFGGLFGSLGGWFCTFICEMAHSACLNDCEGTLDNPKPSMNCVICDQTYSDCLKGCNGPARA